MRVSLFFLLCFAGVSERPLRAFVFTDTFANNHKQKLVYRQKIFKFVPIMVFAILQQYNLFED